MDARAGWGHLLFDIDFVESVYTSVQVGAIRIVGKQLNWNDYLPSQRDSDQHFMMHLRND